jgi:hypothetical protein
VDETMQFTQHVIRNMARGARFAVQEDGNLGIAVADFADERAQFGQRFLRLHGQLFVIDRQDERRSTALLLGKRRQVAITGDAEHFQTFLFDSFGECPNAEAGGVFRTKVFIDDDDGEVKAHVVSLKSGDPPQRVTD